jgi:hypothetical protein
MLNMREHGLACRQATLSRVAFRGRKPGCTRTTSTPYRSSSSWRTARAKSLLEIGLLRK